MVEVGHDRFISDRSRPSKFTLKTARVGLYTSMYSDFMDGTSLGDYVWPDALLQKENGPISPVQP